MQKIREGFETNSSSNHSMVISDSNVINPISYLGVINENNDFIIDGCTQFGWEWTIWDYPADKASYLLIDNIENEYNTDRIREAIKSHIPQKINKVIFKNIDDKKSDKYSDTKYHIDHQSRHITAELINLIDNEAIWKFIMNPESQIRGGNDNEHGPW